MNLVETINSFDPVYNWNWMDHLKQKDINQ